MTRRILTAGGGRARRARAHSAAGRAQAWATTIVATQQTDESKAQGEFNGVPAPQAGKNSQRKEKSI